MIPSKRDAARARLALTILSAFLVSTAALPWQQQEIPSCDSLDGFGKLDFWLGEWDVFDADGNKVGENRIEKILSGCAIMEHWVDVNGGPGTSLFYYNPATDTWKQVWVTPLATVAGGMKEKVLVEELADGGVRFQGKIQAPDGSTYLDRTTLTPLEDGRVKQLIEVSMDGGESWPQGWTGYYVRQAQGS